MEQGTDSQVISQTASDGVETDSMGSEKKWGEKRKIEKTYVGSVGCGRWHAEW
jgi:hypothetical protein